MVLGVRFLSWDHNNQTHRSILYNIRTYQESVCKYQEIGPPFESLTLRITSHHFVHFCRGFGSANCGAARECHVSRCQEQGPVQSVDIGHHWTVCYLWSLTERFKFRWFSHNRTFRCVERHRCLSTNHWIGASWRSGGRQSAKTKQMSSSSQSVSESVLFDVLGCPVMSLPLPLYRSASSVASSSGEISGAWSHGDPWSITHDTRWYRDARSLSLYML